MLRLEPLLDDLPRCESRRHDRLSFVVAEFALRCRNSIRNNLQQTAHAVGASTQRPVQVPVGWLGSQGSNTKGLPVPNRLKRAACKKMGTARLN